MRPFLLVRFSCLLLLAHPAWAQAPGPPGPPTVGVATVQQRPVLETSQFVGRVQAVSRVDLVSRVTAFLAKRLFTEGAEVKAGDILWQLERTPFEATVAQQAAAVAQAQANLVNSNLSLGRQTALLNTPAGQRSLVDDATAQQRASAALLAAAQAQLRYAQVQLDYTEIKAPIDGKISRVSVTAGNVVSPSSGVLATIISQDPMYVVFPVSVRAAFDLRDRYADKGGFKAVQIKLTLPEGTAYAPAGHLDYVDNTVSTNTDTLLFRAIIPNPLRPGSAAGTPGDRELTDGEFVTVSLQGVEPITALAIPRAAVLSDQQGSYVWLVGAGNKVSQRRVQLGQSTADTAVVMSGLTQGETVVAEGMQRVRPGIEVNPAPVPPGPTAAPQAPKA